MNAKIGKSVEMVMLFLAVFSEKMPGAGGRISYKGNKTISQHLRQDSHPQSSEYTSRVLKA